MTTAASATALTGLSAGTWTIDPVHSHASFSVRHMMVSKVRGSFRAFSGAIVVPENGEPTATAEIAVDSFDTGNPQRDGHIRSADFLEVETYPTMNFRSTGLRSAGSDFILDGELTLHGVTRPVELELEFNGVNAGMGDGPVAGFEAKTVLTVAISASTSTCPLRVAASSSATRSTSPWRSRLSCRPDASSR